MCVHACALIAPSVGELENPIHRGLQRRMPLCTRVTMCTLASVHTRVLLPMHAYAPTYTLTHISVCDGGLKVYPNK